MSTTNTTMYLPASSRHPTMYPRILRVSRAHLPSCPPQHSRAARRPTWLPGLEASTFKCGAIMALAAFALALCVCAPRLSVTAKSAASLWRTSSLTALTSRERLTPCDKGRWRLPKRLLCRLILAGFLTLPARADPLTTALRTANVVSVVEDSGIEPAQSPAGWAGRLHRAAEQMAEVEQTEIDAPYAARPQTRLPLKLACPSA